MMKRKHSILGLLLVTVLLVFGLLAAAFPVVGAADAPQVSSGALLPLAQGEDCRADVLLAFSRANAACGSMERNQLCYGNGTVTALLQSGGTPDGFAAAGDVTAITPLRSVQLTSAQAGAAYAVAALQMQANLIDSQTGRSVTVIAFGNADLRNQVPQLPTVTLVASGTLNIRATPEINGEILRQLPLRATLVADGRTQDNRWLRVQIPDTSAVGWVGVDVVTTDGDLSSLALADVNTPYLRPFQVFTLETPVEGDPPCNGAPRSGILLQTPEATAVELTINGVELRLSATVFIYAQYTGEITINVLNGLVRATANGVAQFVPAGARTRVPLEAFVPVGAPVPAEPYLAEEIAGMPVNNLPTRLTVPPPSSAEQIAADVAAAEQAQVMLPTPNPTEIARTRCTRTTTRSTNLWAGPGTFYEIIRELPRGTLIDPAVSYRDSGGTEWWQLRNGSWIQAAAVQSSAACGEIPRTEVVQPPLYNRLTLETCDSSNGPIRAGQYVEIEFVDGGWETLAEAEAAPRIDPGRIVVNTLSLPVYADPPRNVAVDRWYRRFFTTWRAEPGTWQIRADRLTYSLICDVTVPAS